MLVAQLGKMRPLFLVALVLCLNAVGLALSDRLPVPVSSLSLVLLGCAALTLGVVSASINRAVWARELVLRPETEFQEVGAAMFLIRALSFFMATWAFLQAWELTRF